MSVLNSSQLLSIPYESEVLLPICYQISYGVPEKCVEVDFTRIGDFTRRESDCEELVGVTWRVSDYEELSVGYLELCLTCEELVGLLSGNDGVGFENRVQSSQRY